MKYKVGDIFVNRELGVVTILEILDEDNEQGPSKFKCKIFDKRRIQDRIEIMNESLFNMWRTLEIYKFYSVTQDKNKN